LIVFELTRNYDLAIAAMVSVAFANLVGYRIFGRSLFDVQLRQRGFDLRLGRDKVIVEQRQIREFVSNDYTVTSAHAGLDQVLRKLLEQNRHEAYIVDSANHYIGTISMNQLVALSMADRPMTPTAGEFAKPEPLILSPDNSIWEAMAKLENFVGESIPVVDNQVLVGVVFEASIVRAYLHTLDQIRHEEHAAV
jgi:CIC family chloride channel protein